MTFDSVYPDTANPPNSTSRARRHRLTADPRIRVYLEAALVFAVSSCLYLALRTHNYLAVDGAIRALGVYRSPHWFIHGNNHMLYPVDVSAWTAALRLAGFTLGDRFEYLGLVQAMNAIAAGGCLTILFLLVRGAAGRSSLAFLIATGYGASHAFLLHATNSAEPMVGLLWAFVAVFLVALSVMRDLPWVGLVGGAFLALSMATYQSMVLIGPAIIAMIWMPRSWPDLSSTSRVRTLIWFFVGCVSGSSVIYAAAYSFSGFHGLRIMLARFFQIGGIQRSTVG